MDSETPDSAATGDATPPQRAVLRRVGAGLARLEDIVAAVILALMVLLPVIEVLARLGLGRGIPGGIPLTQNLTLWIGFVGAVIAARENRLLQLATGHFLPERWAPVARAFTHAVGAAICVLLAEGSRQLVLVERDSPTDLALGINTYHAQLILPVAFALLAVRLVWSAGRSIEGPTEAAVAPNQVPWSWRPVAFAGLGLAFGLWAIRQPFFVDGAPMGPAWPWLVVLLVATLLGGPIFVAIGGAAVVLFLADGIPAAAIPVETYRLSVQPTLAAIPLFTFAGFLLAEGRASERLLAVFRGFFGWIPGGTAVVCAVVCAFFTVFTGGSGVTILALGGLLFQALQADQYRERFSLGLLTASGSLGLLLPPALPLILYGIVAEISIEDLFIGGIFPGLLMIGLIAGWGLREGIRTGVPKTPFDAGEGLRATWAAKWELLLPIVILAAIFSGFATVVEASAVAAAYVVISQCFVHRDVRLVRDLPRVMVQCSVLVGGVLIILGVAMGLTSYMVDARIAQGLLDLVSENISSKLVFLLCLNLFLLLVGCLMDIFSATVVVVPLILPLGAAFDIHPVHLGILFIANLELGYLTPPVGLNLFLASYRFDRPLLEVYRAALPMLVILGIGVLLVAYWPGLTLGLLGWLGRL